MSPRNRRHPLPSLVLAALAPVAAAVADDSPAERVAPCVAPAAEPAVEADGPEPRWVDRTEHLLHEGACRSARWVDGLFGADRRTGDYPQASGTVATSLLWSQHAGWQPHVRFHAQLPLPQAEDRLHAFVGTYDRGEFVAESSEPSGALPRQFGPAGEDQTLLGLGYSPPGSDTGRFDTSAGVRLQWPPDPYVKASHQSLLPRGGTTVLQARETVFWEAAEGIGATLRGDVDRAFGPHMLSRTTLSATYSQRSLGVRGYGTATLFRQLSERRAIAYQLGFDGSTDAAVPLHDFGARVSYRQRLWEDWLAIELRGSLEWPRDTRAEPRVRSVGVGIGFELAFGGARFRGLD